MSDGLEETLGRIETPSELPFSPGDVVAAVPIQREDGEMLDLPHVAGAGPALLVFFRGFW